MQVNRFFTLLAITAIIIVVASGAIATTWDAFADFSQTSATGVWSYGSCRVTNNGWVSTDLDIANYVFSAHTYASASFREGDAAGFCWGERSNIAVHDNWTDYDPNAFVGVLTGSAYWVFSGPGLYVKPNAIGFDNATGWASVIRWTAPTAGTFSLTGSVTDLMNGYSKDVIVKTDQSGNRTVVQSGSSTNTIAGGVTLGAGETLDLICFQSPVYQREYDKISLTITGGDVPEPGSMLALGAGLLSFGGLALRRRK